MCQLTYKTLDYKLSFVILKKKKIQIIKKVILIMHCCQPLVLIFQFLKILNKELQPLLSLNFGSVPGDNCGINDEFHSLADHNFYKKVFF